MRLAATVRAVPPHHFDQETLVAALRAHLRERGHSEASLRRLEAMHRRVLVGGRYLALPLERYDALKSFGDANDTYIEVACELGERAAREALERSGLDARDVGAFLFITTTGVATPSIDARLMNRLDLSPRVKRMPLFGLGCVAGAAGVARAADYVRAHPGEAALLLSVELCSLTLQTGDVSVANQIASGLFGDGAAAVVVAGEELPGPGPRVLASRSAFYRDTERVMGWDIGEGGFTLVLSPEVPEMVARHLVHDVDEFLKEQGLGRGDIGAWICHPGGPKVIAAMQETFGLPPEAFAATWASLRRVGNLSSASVMHVLAETIEGGPPAPGTYGLMLAMGPGFCSEQVLLRW